jgi:uncharacterized caspase-like protein
MRVSIGVFLSFCLMILTALEAHADRRVALVIGNGAYRNVPALTNPTNDASDVAASLKRSGFDVISETDLDQNGMQDAFIRFARGAQGADVALFYYSGHALQFAGVNYLVPVDAIVRDEVDLRRMARADDILADLQQAKNLRILVLDACRDNPFAENLKRSAAQSRAVGVGRGLAKMESPEGTIISYATQAGRTADDGDGRNSPYTYSFLKHIQDKDNITAVFQAISAGVYEQTKGSQTPELSLSFFGEFYLNGKSEKATITSPQTDPCADAAEHWRSAEAIGTAAAFEDHIVRFPDCTFAGLAKSRIAALSKPADAAKPVNPFDGTWVVNEVCTSKPPFWPAATLQYALQITDGTLHTTFGEDGKPGSSTFDGKIGVDGSAKISVSGYTNPASDPLHRAAGTPFRYALALEFKQSRGTGVRIETPRPCRMDLSKLSATDPSAANADGIPGANQPNEVSLPSPAILGKDSNLGQRNAEPQTGNGLNCSTMRSRCGAACVANTGRPDCASTVCVRLEQECLSTGCWKGRGFNGCGLAKR